MPHVEQERWFNQEVHPHDGQLKAYLRGEFPRVRENVEDVVQESYLRIWKAKTTHEITSAKAFLFRIARNLALNLIRSENRSPIGQEGDIATYGVLDESPNAAEVLSAQETADLLADALLTLPARTRTIFLLHKIDGLTQVEVAEKLGLTRKIVEHQVERGLRLCNEYLRARGYDLS